MLYFCYSKIVQEKKFQRVNEVQCLAFAFIPSLVLSIPPSFSLNISGDCWDTGHDPLKEILASFGFVIPYLLGFVVNFAIVLGIKSHLLLFPKGFYSEEYEKKQAKFANLRRFSLLIYANFFWLFIYAVLLLLKESSLSLDYFSMFFYALNGFFTLVLFLKSKNVKKSMSDYFKNNRTVVNILPEDEERLPYMSSFDFSDSD